MTDKTWNGIVKAGYVLVILSIILGLGNCSCNCVKRKLAEGAEQTRLRKIKEAEIESHYPNRGDMIVMDDGKKIMILKKLFWKTERTYEVRLEDGTITQVMGSEIKDKKPINDPNTSGKVVE